MEIMNLPRGYGKTTNTIIEAVKTDYPVIVGYGAMKKEFERRAKEICNKNITVYTISEFCDDNFWRGKIDNKPEKVIIDELPLVLEQLLGCKCEIATMTSKSLEEYYKYRDYSGCRTKGE